MKRILIETLFTVLITELTVLLILMILFSTLTTVIKILMMALVFVSCKYFRMNVQASGRWLETCEVTDEQLIWRYGELIKSDRCPFKEVKNV